MHDIESHRLRDAHVGRIHLHPRGDGRRHAAFEEPSRGGERALGQIEAVDERRRVGAAPRHHRRRLPHEPHARRRIGQDLDVAVGLHDDRCRRHEIRLRHRELPGEAGGIAIDDAAGPKFNHRVAGNRLGQRNRDGAAVLRHAADVDDARRARLVDGPRRIDRHRDGGSRAAAGGDAQPREQFQSRSADRVAVVRLDHDAALPRSDPHGQRGRLRVVGEGGHEALPPCRRGGVDPPDAWPGRPLGPPFALDDEAHAAPLPPRLHLFDREAGRLERQRLRRIERSLALQVDHGLAVAGRVDGHVDRRRRVAAPAGHDHRRRTHPAGHGSRRQSDPHRAQRGREVSQPHSGIGEGMPAVDPHEAFDGGLRHAVPGRRAGLGVGDPNPHVAGQPGDRSAAAVIGRGGRDPLRRRRRLNTHGRRFPRRDEFHGRCRGGSQPEHHGFGVSRGIDGDGAFEDDDMARVAPLFRHVIEPQPIAAAVLVGVDDHPPGSFVPRRAR